MIISLYLIFDFLKFERFEKFRFQISRTSRNEKNIRILSRNMSETKIIFIRIQLADLKSDEVELGAAGVCEELALLMDSIWGTLIA